MIGFNSYLTESLDVEKLKHLEHAEDHIIHGGHEGVKHAASTLEDVHNFLQGKKTTTKITQKYDGAPSVVFGRNPENGKFFVASKSAFNKDPKLNYSPKDIEANHGHAPGLVEKLKAALEHLPKIMPKEGGVYQGDLMYTKPDVTEKESSYSFTPNTITYEADKDSAHGRKIAASKLGIVVHTKYKGKKLDDMKADFNVNHGSFKQDPDVHTINPEIDQGQISNIESKKYKDHINKATQLYSSMDPDIFNTVDGHDVNIKTYINDTVRNDTKPTADGYHQFMKAKLQKEVDKLKSEAGKKKKQEQADTVLSHIKAHKKQLGDILQLHGHMQQAKDTLVGALSRNQEFKTTIGGKATKPEGFVATRGGRPSKLVDRADFSRSNFLTGAFRKNEEQEPPADSKPKNPVVFSFGRMNPPTTGHKVLVDRVHDLAKENNAKHSVVLSHSVDPEKNPLTAEQKLKHAKRFFPKTNLSVASKEEPSFLHHAQKLHKAGHDHLIMVAGSDRVDEYKKTLDKYNGEGEGKLFNFKKVDVVSAGQRDPDAEGDVGMSASKMRGHAITNKFGEFKKGIPSHIHPEHARELYNDVRKGMDIKIDANTPAISLGKYSKRQDIIGARARKEQERRARMKQSMVKRGVKEENLSIIMKKTALVETLLSSVRGKFH